MIKAMTALRLWELTRMVARRDTFVDRGVECGCGECSISGGDGIAGKADGGVVVAEGGYGGEGGGVEGVVTKV